MGTVLEEKYSLDKFKQCGSMSSTQGCGDEDIRRSIESLCQQCDHQAGDDASKTALKDKCDSILASAPAAAMSRLYSENTASAKGFLSMTGKLGLPQFASGVFVVAIAGAFVGLVRRTRGSFQQISDVQPAMQASVAEQGTDDVFDRESLITS